MGELVNRRCTTAAAALVAVGIVSINGFLVFAPLPELVSGRREPPAGLSRVAGVRHPYGSDSPRSA